MDVELLAEYRRLVWANQSILARVEAMRAREVQVTPQQGDGSQHAGAGDPMRKVDDRIDYVRSVSQEYRANECKMRYIEDAVNKIPDVLERNALWLYYMAVDNGRKYGYRDVSMKIYGTETHTDMVKRLIREGRRKFAAL